MNRIIFLLILSFLLNLDSYAQVSINQDNSNADPSSMLHIKSTDKGLLIPRMTSAQRSLINSPALGLLVFDSDTESFWFKETGGWVELGGNSAGDEIADADHDTKIQTEVNPDEDKIRFDMGGTEYFVMDSGRIHVKNTGGSVFLGDSAGVNDDFSDNKNTFIGKNAGQKSTGGYSNVAIGYNSFRENQSGSNNTTVGESSLHNNSSGSYNSAFGLNSLENNTIGSYNMAFGGRALLKNTNGYFNVGVGVNALSNMQTGFHNIGIGHEAGGDILDGTWNIFIGSLAGQSSPDSLHIPYKNVIIGHAAGRNNKGSGNIFLGYQAAQNVSVSNRLFIENSSADSTNTLIYGEFDNDFLRFNANTLVRDTLILPTGAADGFFLRSDANGKSSWAASEIPSFIQDSDNDTKIQVEANPDEDMIRMSIDGTEKIIISDNANGETMMSFPNNQNNIFLGEDAGIFNTTGIFNLFIGNQAGESNTEGAYNVFHGYQAGFKNTTGWQNTFLGIQAGNKNTTGSENLFIGFQTGFKNTTGSENLFMGTHAGSQNTAGDHNIFLGHGTGQFNKTGSRNIFLGNRAGLLNTIGNQNVSLGDEAGLFNTTGSQNVFLGSRSGQNSQTVDKNIFIGFESGFFENDSSRLYIESSNADSANALIYGQFDNDFLRLNANTLVRDTLILPAGASDGYFLQSDADGKASWTAPEMITSIHDADNDTKIQVEESADEDIIRFDAVGQEIMRIDTAAVSINKYTEIKGSDRNNLTIRSTNNAQEAGLAFRNAGSSYTWSIFRQPVSGNVGQAHLLFAGGTSQNNPDALTERMRISNTGNVGINTNSPGEKLHVAGSIRMVDGNQAIGYIPVSDANGTMIWTDPATLTFGTSDIRLKTKITPTTFGLSDVMNIDVKDYYFKDELDRPRTGFIAQQLYKHYPEAVSIGGEDEKTDPWMVDYGQVTPLLVKAIQEQQVHILELEKKLGKALEWINQNSSINESKSSLNQK